MSRVQDTNPADEINCNCFNERTDEWMYIELTNITDENNDPSDFVFCIKCADVLSEYLGIDFEDDAEGFFRFNELGQVQSFKKDCN